MPTKKVQAFRMKNIRSDKRKKGLVPVEVWIHPDHAEKLKKYVAKCQKPIE